jgi:hypothetical protein
MFMIIGTAHKSMNPDNEREIDILSESRSLSFRKSKVQPMTTRNIQIIQLDASKKDCKLSSVTASKLYYIKKVVFEDDNAPVDDVVTLFIASLTPTFVRIEDGGLANNYEHQLGYSRCSKGYIDYVRVNDGTANAGEINARDCGISTVLTALCMVDPQLNIMSRSKIDRKFRDNNRISKAIKKGCSKFVGLRMQADPLTGAFAYLSAATTYGYNKMWIKKDDDKTFILMETDKVWSCYDSKTGRIGGERGEGIEGLDKEWWFCDEIPGKLPIFSTLDSCSKTP